MKVQELLVKTLEDLGKKDFKDFQWYCQMEILDGCEPLSKSRLEEASRAETVSVLIGDYKEEQAVRITIEILKKMRQNNLAEKLENKYAAAGGTSTSSSAQSPAAAAAAAAAAPAAGMSAQHGSVINAQTISNCIIGTLNANTTK